MEDSQNTLKATNSVLQSESLSLTSILRGRAEDQNKKDSRAASLEQMRLNLKERIANLGLNPKNKESSQEESKSDSSNGYCKTHPDEALQFYCFSTNQCLCSECLLSGAFAGCDVVNIKKAGEKVRLKLEGVLREITQKTDQIAELDQEMKKKKQEITDSTLEIKTQISNLFQELVNAVQQKEQEVLEKLKNASEENLRLIEPKHKSIKDQYDEFADLKQVLEGKLSGLKDAELCQYYSSKSQLLKNFIDEKGSSIAQNLKVDGSAQNLREQFNPDHYKEVIVQLQENIRDLKCPEQKMKTSDLKFFQNRTAKQSDNSRASGDILQESIPQPLAAKKSLNVYEESDTAGSSFLRPRSTSPFGTFRNGLEGTSPLPVAVTAKETPVVENQADNTLRRLFQRIEEVRKTPQPIKEEPEPRKDMRSNSFSKLSIDLQSHNASRASLADIHLQSTSKLGYFDAQKEKESSNKFWDTYKIHIEDQSRKRLELTPSTSLLGGFERSKTPTKSYIQEFAKSKGATGSELFKKKDLLNNSSTPSQGMSSTKNLRGLLQDEPVRPTHIKNMRSFGHEDQFKEQANEGWKLNFRRNEESSTSFGNVNKSFGSTNLNSNFLKLKKQIGLWKDE